MASITIRRLDDNLRRRLKARAAAHGCSMEEEARRILRQSLEQTRPETIADIGRELFGPKHGFHLPSHPRVTPRPPPAFDE